MVGFPEPGPKQDVSTAILEYLDYFRDMVTRKVFSLSPADRERSAVPTGWTPEELLTHLLYMERRWVVWGFCGEGIEEPFADSPPTGGWRADPDRTLEELADQLARQGRTTRRVVLGAALTDPARRGGRFSTEAGPTPTLLSILLHLNQEYARHAGHLDVACEILAGITGE